MHMLRIFAAACMVILFVWAILNAGRTGYSRVLANAAAGNDTIAWADKAVRMSPLDPQAHYLRAEVLRHLDRLPEATSELENAASLRPRHYSLELRVGYARERLQDWEGALRAYQRSVRLAPYYSQPRWYLGRLLLKSGQQKPAFAELRRAVNSDPALLDDVIRIAGEVFGDNSAAIEDAVQPQSGRERLALATFLVRRKKTAEAMALFHSSGTKSPEELRTLLEALLSSKRYPEAFEVWSLAHSGGGLDSIVNGGFETPIVLKDPGFGWQVAANDESLKIYSDTVEPGVERRSLRLDFSGNPDTSRWPLYQIVLVQPNTQYQLNFAARAKELATLSLPVVGVRDAAHWSLLLGWTAIERDTANWSNQTVEFTTGESTTAVIIGLEREACDASCAIYGHLWLDNFSLRKF